MKLNQKLAAISILLFSILFMIACDKGTNSEDLSLNDYTSSDLYLLGKEDAMSGIEDATIDKDMRFASYFEGHDFPPRKDFDYGRKHGRKFGFRHGFKGKGFHLGRIFFKLELNEDQREQIKDAMIANRECLAEPFEDFREAAKEIMEGTKEDRKAIHDRVKAGEISREEARELIKVLNESTREKIENCTECAAALEDICACNEVLIEAITLILDEDQISVWEEWLNDHPTPCS